jgi:hypothetical protein
LLEGLKGVCGITANYEQSFAVVQSGDVFSWGRAAADLLRPILVEGFGGVRVCSVSGGAGTCFAIG